jgi:flotillin
MTSLIILSILGVAVLGVILFLVTYKVVDPNMAHIVVRMGKGRKLYAPKLSGSEGVAEKTSYFFIPRLMTRQVLPLTNIKMDIPDIHLNDLEVAPFVCDVVTWIRIDNPITAAERLNLDHPNGAFGSLGDDLKGIVHAIAREVAMRQEILDILRDRKTFSQSVSDAVNGVLKEWGVDLVNLEVIDIKDDVQKNSRVIADYESVRKVKVNTEARKQNATLDREAIEVEQDNRKTAEIATADAEEQLRKRQIEKDKNIGIAQKEQEADIAKAQELANEQTVSAERRLQVGLASVQKEASIEKATGDATAIKIRGEKEAEVITLKGQAEGNAIEAKGTAEAVAKDKMAAAMAKFNEAATTVEKIRAAIEVQKAMWEAYGKVASNAEIKIVNSGKGASLFGMPLNAESGADLGQMLEGLNLSQIVSAIKGPTPTDKKE